VLYDPTFKPRLRPVEPIRLDTENGTAIVLRDRAGLCEAVLTVSEAALLLMTLFDGEQTCDEIRRAFLAQFGHPLAAEKLQSVVEQLDRAKFLDGPSFDAYYDSLLLAYRRGGTRRMRAGMLPGLDGSGRMFEQMLAGSDDAGVAQPIAGFIAPHLDYPRGRPCYAAAYATLRHRRRPERVVILGTNHFGRSNTVVATANDFVTPFGTTRTDRGLLDQLESRCGDLRTFELDHLREHSVELQVAWLQHLYGAGSFRLLAVLCPDPCGPSGTQPSDGKGVNLRDFATILGEVLAADADDTLLIAGADLSHVGAAFGDQRTLDDAFLGAVRRRDQGALARLAAGDPEGFRDTLAEDSNPTRVCSAGCIFVLATVLKSKTPTLLAYHQAVDIPTQTCVTCAAVAYT